MTDPTEAVSGLIERIEAAGGPDRELDAEIWAFVHSGYIEINSLGRPVVWHEDKGWVKHPVSLGDGIWRERKLLGDITDAPRYTASLDHAMMLVPESCHVELERWSDGRGRCEVRWTAHTECAWAATPALALAAAALRARPTPSIKGGDRG